jgi:hypothetical protein
VIRPTLLPLRVVPKRTMKLQIVTNWRPGFHNFGDTNLRKSQFE